MATPVPVPLPDPDNHSLSIYGSSVYPCQVPGPFPCRTVATSRPTDSVTHPNRNTIHPTSLVPSLLQPPPLTYFPCGGAVNPQEQPQNGARPCRDPSPPALISCAPRKKNFTTSFFFSLFLQPVMRLVHSEYSSDRSVGRASLPAVTTVIGRARVAPSRDR